GMSIRRGYPDRTRIWVYFLDDENLSLYMDGMEFFPGGVLNLSSVEEISIILPDDRNWNILVPGLDLPYSTSDLDLSIAAFRSVLYPEAMITSPAQGIYTKGEVLQFNGVLEPYTHYMGELSYFWFLDDQGEPISTLQEFDMELELGDHKMILSIWNRSGEISRDTVHISIVLPLMPPTSNISSPEDGLIVDFGTDIHFSSAGSTDPNGDVLEYEWKDTTRSEILSLEPSFTMKLKKGDHCIRLNVSDPIGLFSLFWVNVTVLEPNTPPVPYISSPIPYSEFDEDELIHLSGNASFDLEQENLTFRWYSSIDGLISDEIEEDVRLTSGEHVITLWISDGKLNATARVIVYIKEKEILPDREPIVNISSPKNGENFFVSDLIRMESRGSHDPEGSPLVYEWSLDGRVISNTRVHEMMLGPGVHTVTLKVSDGNHSVQESITILVTNRAPVISIKVNGTKVGGQETVY
ncbi:MAG: hypothetical protein U9R75_00165, partial [Candidatus Thermoplasmatota archaeon]|nr:hypothetical protein [Candidatus Thermoplasmatota archaeon]